MPDLSSPGSLLVLGVVLLLAALLGGGIDFLGIKIPAIPRRGHRFGVGGLGAILMVYAVVITYWPPPSVVTDNFSDAVAPTPETSPPPTTTLSGTVDPSYHEDNLRDRYTDYSILATPSGQTEEFSDRLDKRGQFHIVIVGIPQMADLNVSWGVSRPSEFVIWPLTYPSVPLGQKLQAFRFQRLPDVFGNEKRRMFEAVTSGNFGEANQRLKTVRQLFERLGVRDATTGPITGCIRRWRFTIHRDLAQAAYEYRDRVGRSEITRKHVQTEREWRRMMINKALDQPEDGQRLRDFARAANSWAQYAREVFSREQRSWPDRSLASRETENGAEFLAEDDRYAQWLLEDIVLIKKKLELPEIEKLVNENANRQAQLARLSDGQRQAVESFPTLLDQDAVSVSMNKFVNLLSALKLLAVSCRLAGRFQCLARVNHCCSRNY